MLSITLNWNIMDCLHACAHKITVGVMVVVVVFLSRIVMVMLIYWHFFINTQNPYDVQALNSITVCALSNQPPSPRKQPPIWLKYNAFSSIMDNPFYLSRRSPHEHSTRWYYLTSIIPHASVLSWWLSHRSTALLATWLKDPPTLSWKNNNIKMKNGKWFFLITHSWLLIFFVFIIEAIAVVSPYWCWEMKY